MKILKNKDSTLCFVYGETYKYSYRFSKITGNRPWKNILKNCE